MQRGQEHSHYVPGEHDIVDVPVTRVSSFTMTVANIPGEADIL